MRRLTTHPRPGATTKADRRAQSTDGSLRVVPRPEEVRHGAALRLRHGHRAIGGVDMRSAPSTRNNSLPTYARQDISVSTDYRVPSTEYRVRRYSVDGGRPLFLGRSVLGTRY